ncbi:MAG: arginase family protein [Nanoarchaeota archaeon]
MLNKYKPTGKLVSPKWTFLDNTENHPFDKADVCCLGVAMDLTASYTKGTWYGPEAAIDASHQIEYEVPLFHKPMTEHMQIHNLGILEYPKPTPSLTGKKLSKIMEGMVADVKGFSKKAFDKGKLLMTFGGDHSIPNGIFQAIAEQHGAGNVTVFHVDAHLDLRLAYEDQKYSHASILRNCRELGFPTIQVGIRDHISEEEANYLERKKLGEWIYWCPTMPSQFYKDHASTLQQHPILKNLIPHGHLTSEQIQKICGQIKTKYAYITIDCDGIDATEMPGTGTPLPHGLTLRTVEESIYAIIQHCKKNGVQLLGFDINEISPLMRKESRHYKSQDTVTAMTEMKVALLAYKILFWQFVERFKN